MRIPGHESRCFSRRELLKSVGSSFAGNRPSFFGVAKRRFLSSLLILACLGACPDEPIDKTPYPFVTDSAGRALILRGINVMSNAKSDPLRMPNISKEDVRRMVEDWGFNHVRFLVFWDAIEPQKGVYDAAYLERVAERLDWFAEVGIHVVLDMHQDVYAARFCCDGAPEWAIRDDGKPFELQGQWFLNYFQPAVRAAFDNFWQASGDHADLQVHYRAAWMQVVRRFKDHPAVIGYDLMNEPHPGSMIDEAELLGLPNPASPSPIFDERYLSPFYQRLIDVIRQEDSQNWIFFEPRYGAPGNGAATWISDLNDPREGPPRLVYYPHLYSISLEASQRYAPDDQSVSDWEIERGKELARWEMPMAIGEWGLDRSTENWQGFVADVLTMADRMLAGWAYWSYDPGAWGIIEHGEERAETELADHLIRPYAQVVAGRPTAMSFDAQTKAFSLNFERRQGVTGDSLIYIPQKRHYPAGFTAILNGELLSLDGVWDEGREILSLALPSEGSSFHLVISAN
jgi:endoglycosylceramidase